MKLFGQFMFGLLLSIPISIFRAWVFSKLWGWFIVTTFTLKPINTLQAFGIIILISMFSKLSDKIIDEDNFIIDTISELTKSFLISSWILGIGWIISLFF